MGRILFAFLAVSLLFTAPVDAQPAEPMPTCFGQPATLTGTPNDDVLVGGPGADVIVGLGGDDTIRGLGGDDLICGGDGTDRITGGPGDDQLSGDGARDVIAGGPGHDSIWGGGGRDRLRGGAGLDVLNGNQGRDNCIGGRGFDRAGYSCESIDTETQFQILEIDGAQVWSTAPKGGIPQNASRVLFDTTVLDDGDGPELCIGGIAESYPPQCGGFRLPGFEMVGDWFETAGAVRWGTRRLVVNWPPVDDAVRVRSVGPANFGIDRPQEHNFGLPAACQGLTTETATQSSVMGQWGQSNPDLFGGIWIADSSRDNLGVPVLQVKGSDFVLNEVRSELTTDERTPCVVAVDFTRQELFAVQETLRPLFDTDVGLTEIGIGKDGVGVGVVVADLATIQTITSLVDRPELLKISAGSVIVR